MKTQLLAIIAKLSAMQERAEEMQDSENDATVERYETIANAIDDAITLLQDALDGAFP